MEYPPHSPDLVPSDFWLLPEIRCALKGRRFPDIEDGTESNSTTGVQKMFPTVTVLLS
jgi:hypothetical protein